jgi:hypothetical protein
MTEYDGSKLTFIRADDWVALYCGDEGAGQGHEIQLSDLLDFLNIDYEEIWSEEHERLDDYAMSNGRFPDTLEEVKELLD